MVLIFKGPVILLMYDCPPLCQSCKSPPSPSLISSESPRRTSLWNVETPATSSPPPVTLTPDLAVTNPTESILVTSS